MIENRARIAQMTRDEKIDLLIRRFLEPPETPVYVLPGGVMPEVQSDGAACFDVHARAVVHVTEKDANNRNFRHCLFDFVKMPSRRDDPQTCDKIVKMPPVEYGIERELRFRMDPGDRALVGVGIVIGLDESDPEFYVDIRPRSGLASKYGITLGNAPGTGDSDYRGEYGIVLINQGREPFFIEHNMRIAQISFTRNLIPRLVQVDSYEKLPQTKRGSGGFGSTGNSWDRRAHNGSDSIPQDQVSSAQVQSLTR